MKVLSRYIFKEVVFAWFAAGIVLQFVVSSNYLARALSDVAKGRIPADLVFTQFWLQSLESLNLLMPLSLFLGIMLALGRFQRDSEWVIMRSTGFGELRMIRALLLPGLLGVLLTAAFSLWISPWADRTSDALIVEAASEAGLAGLVPGRFETIAGGAATVYVGDISPDNGSLQGVFVFADHGGVESITTAISGDQKLAGTQEQPYLQLNEGQRIEGKPGSAEYRMLTFQSALIRLPMPEAQVVEVELESVPTTLLMSSSDLQERIELYWRLAMPLAAAILVLAAVPLARSAPRSGRGGRLFIGVLAYLLYSNMIVIARDVARKEQFDILVSMGAVHFIALIVVLFSLRKAQGVIAPAKRLINEAS